MKHLIIPGAIAAAISGAALLIPHKTTHEVAYSSSTSPHAWASLSAPQKKSLVAALGSLKGSKVIIVCADGACTDLAHDLDDILEDVGADSVLDRPAFPLGYGIGIAAGPALEAKAKLLQASLSRETSLGTLPIMASKDDGYLIVAIGKKRTK